MKMRVCLAFLLVCVTAVALGISSRANDSNLNIPPAFSILSPKTGDTVKCQFDILGTAIGSPSVLITDENGIAVQGSTTVNFIPITGTYDISVKLCNAGNEDIWITVIDGFTGNRKTEGPIRVSEQCPPCGTTASNIKFEQTQEPPMVK